MVRCFNSKIKSQIQYRRTYAVASFRVWEFGLLQYGLVLKPKTQALAMLLKPDDSHAVFRFEMAIPI